MTPQLIKVVYIVGACFITAAGLLSILSPETLNEYEAGPILTRLGGILVLLVGNLVWRMMCEGAILLFSPMSCLSASTRGRGPSCCRVKETDTRDIRPWHVRVARQAGALQLEQAVDTGLEHFFVRLGGCGLDHETDDNIVGVGIAILRAGVEGRRLAGDKASSSRGDGGTCRDAKRAFRNASSGLKSTMPLVWLRSWASVTGH